MAISASSCATRPPPRRGSALLICSRRFYRPQSVPNAPLPRPPRITKQKAFIRIVEKYIGARPRKSSCAKLPPTRSSKSPPPPRPPKTRKEVEGSRRCRRGAPGRAVSGGGVPGRARVPWPAPRRRPPPPRAPAAARGPRPMAPHQPPGPKPSRKTTNPPRPQPQNPKPRK